MNRRILSCAFHGSARKALIRAVLSLSVILAVVALAACPNPAGGGGEDDPVKPSYTVTYYGNGSTGGTVPVESSSYHEGYALTVKDAGGLVKDGFFFAGWNTAADGNGTTYTTGQTLTIGTEDIALYALWSSNPVYTITYNANGATGGSVPVDSTNYEQGQTATVLGNTGGLVKTSNHFTGWNTEADGSGTTYQSSWTFAMGSANVTLYAQWALNPYAVFYDANGATSGTAPTDSILYQTGQNVTVLGNSGNLARTGYTFVGWCTNSIGLDPVYTEGSTFAMGTNSVCLYAAWSINIFSVTYDGNGATGGTIPAAENYQYNYTATVEYKGDLVKVQDGISLRFAGWNTAADGSGSSYTPGSTFPVTSNLTLYATWRVLGGTGPAGGFVFYDKEEYSSGWRYLEAAPEEESDSIPWYNGTYTTTGATDTAIGSGQSNTTAIVTNQGSGSYAAKICDDLILGGKSDWFLPSSLELYELLHIAALLDQLNYPIGSFCWSSSESASDSNLAISNYCLSPWELDKSESAYIVAVRMF